MKFFPTLFRDKSTESTSAEVETPSSHNVSKKEKKKEVASSETTSIFV